MLLAVDVECWLCGRPITDQDNPEPWIRKSDGATIYSHKNCYHECMLLEKKYKYNHAQVKQQLTECRLVFCGGD